MVDVNKNMADAKKKARKTYARTLYQRKINTPEYRKLIEQKKKIVDNIAENRKKIIANKAQIQELIERNKQLLEERKEVVRAKDNFNLPKCLTPGVKPGSLHPKRKKKL